MTVLLLEKSTTQKVLSVIYNGDEYILEFDL